MASPEAGGDAADVVYVLCLLQVGFLLLAAIGEVLLMGGQAVYLLVPLAKVVLLLFLAAKAVARRPYALVGLIVLQCVTLLGFGVQLWAGLLPVIDYTVNLVGLMTNVALPAAVVYLCARLLPARRRPVRTLARKPVPPLPEHPTWPVHTMERNR